MSAVSQGAERVEVEQRVTPLELFFDLVFVGAVAQGAEGLHHAIVTGHAEAGLGGYAMVFFAIWWAWMNFTWFASAYDSDDVPYRLAVFVQIAGALIFASGVAAMVAARASSSSAGPACCRPIATSAPSSCCGTASGATCCSTGST